MYTSDLSKRVDIFWRDEMKTLFVWGVCDC